ncbi:MAG: LPS export ABC transporter periplasmic protein LptC [Pseudomonadota bacterium]
MSQTSSSPAPERGKSVKGAAALTSIDFKTRTTGAEAEARSRLVRRLRVALPILAAILIVAFIINTRSNSVDQAFLDDFKTITAATEELRMANPRFAGKDDDGKPFEITADAAMQNPAEKDIVALESPRAVQGGDDTESVVSAQSGLYRSEENILELSDDVTLEHELGANTYILRSPKATVSIKDQVVTSDAGVGAVGPDGGALKADRMKAYRADGRVVFEGNVSMRIYPKKDSDGAAVLPALRDGDSKDEAENEGNEE